MSLSRKLVVQNIPQVLPGKTIVKASGSWLTCSSGTKYLDFTCGIGVTNTGHCHPKIVRAAQDQCSQLIHGQVNIGFNDQYLKLAEKLHDSVQGAYDQFFFANSGSEAVENALKIARKTTGRTDIIAFSGGFHGRTTGALALTSSSTTYKAGTNSNASNVHFAPFPYELHGQSHKLALEALDVLLRQQVDPSDVAAMIIEPVLGEGGYVPAPPGFLHDLRKICDKHGILLIMDEVQTGFGRTGDMFASLDGDGVQGDILVMAKGLASGFPLSAVGFSSELSEKITPGVVGGTYGGNAVSCAAAIATQEVIVEEDLISNSRIQGSRLMQRLEALKQDFPEIWEVRGKGCMVGLEFTKEIPSGTKSRIVSECAEAGLLLLGASIFETIRFIPPLTVTGDEVDQSIERFEHALKKVFC